MNRLAVLFLIASACAQQVPSVTINNTTIVESTNPDQPAADTHNDEDDVVDVDATGDTDAQTEVPTADTDVSNDTDDVATEVERPEWCTHQIYGFDGSPASTEVNPTVHVIENYTYVGPASGIYLVFVVDAGPCDPAFVVERASISVNEMSTDVDLVGPNQWGASGAHLLINDAPVLVGGNFIDYQATELWPSRDYTPQSTLGWTFSSPTVRQGHVLNVLPIGGSPKFTFDSDSSAFDTLYSYEGWETMIGQINISITLRELDGGHVWDIYESRPLIFTN